MSSTPAYRPISEEDRAQQEEAKAILEASRRAQDEPRYVSPEVRRSIEIIARVLGYHLIVGEKLPADAGNQVLIVFTEALHQRHATGSIVIRRHPPRAGQA